MIDAWYDSGSMPFAQWGYPHVEGSEERFEQAFPADFICEAIDQTRGWFYTLMAVGTLVFDAVVVRERALPGPHPGRGRPQDVQAPGQHPRADAADGRARRRRGALVHGRRRVAVGGPPGRAHHDPGDRPQGAADLLEHRGVPGALRRPRGLVARADARARRRRDRPVLDRWALSEAHRLVGDVTAALEDFDTQRAGTLLAAYVDDLSNWYVRRSRRRFWDGDPAALATLHECLYVVTRLMAPLAPFITERVWQDVFAADVDRAARVGAPGRLADARRRRWSTTSLGRADGAGPAAGRARPRRPGRGEGADPPAAAPRPGRHRGLRPALRDELRREVAEELNVGALEPLSAAGATWSTTARRATSGRSASGSASDTPLVAAAIAAADAAAARRGAARRRARPRVDVDGEQVEVLRRRGDRHRAPARGLVGGQRAGRDRRARPRAHPGAACAPAWPARWSGWSRRPARPAGFEVTDRIALGWQADGELAEALREHGDADRRRGARHRRCARRDAPTAWTPSRRDLGLTFTRHRV